MSDAVGQLVPVTIQLRILFIYRSLPVSFLGIKTQAAIGQVVIIGLDRIVLYHFTCCE